VSDVFAETLSEDHDAGFYPPSKPTSLLAVWIALSLGLAGVAGLTFLLLRPPAAAEPVPAPATVPASKAVPTTWPPLAVPGIARLPADLTAIAVLQPRACIGYAQRTGRTLEELLRDLNLPAWASAGLDSLSLPIDTIVSVVVGLRLRAHSPIPQVVAIVTLREPLGDDQEAALLARIQAQKGVDGRYQATIGTIPVEFLTIAPGQYAFATDAADLPKPLSPMGEPRFNAALQDGIGRLSPASVAWFVTERREWAAVPAIRLLSEVTNRKEWLTAITGVEAVATGFSFEPDPKWRLAIRGGDATAVGNRLGVHHWDSEGGWQQAEQSIPLPAHGK
jgi:hypothetical protein